jgi:hypothetical protein
MTYPRSRSVQLHFKLWAYTKLTNPRRMALKEEYTYKVKIKLYPYFSDVVQGAWR